MLVTKVLLLSVIVALASSSYSLSQFWCGFHNDFCGKSTKDDINPKANFVILAFANIQPDGSILVDHSNFPSSQVCYWQSTGKKVLISIGGVSGNWSFAFASNRTIQIFVTTLVNVVQQYNLDGVDLDIEHYSARPRTVAHAIKCLKKALGTKLLMVSPQCINVYQGAAIPTLDTANHPFNYFVPIIKKVGKYIDYYQIQAYNNWYDYFPGGSTEYLIDIYLNWRNLQGLSPQTKPIPNFKGVPGSKIFIGLLASQKAGGIQYYSSLDEINNFKKFLKQNKYSLKGFMIWNSYWDSLNKYVMSNAAKRKIY